MAIARPPHERLLARLYLGPAGHLWSVAADLAIYAVGRARARVRFR